MSNRDLKCLRRRKVRIACARRWRLMASRARSPPTGEFPPAREFDLRCSTTSADGYARVVSTSTSCWCFRPPFSPTSTPLMSLQQRISRLMPADLRLPRARSPASDCGGYRSLWPERSLAGGNCSTKCWHSRICARCGGGIQSFEFLRGMGLRDRVDPLVPDRDRAVASDDWSYHIDDRDGPRADLVLGQLRGRCSRVRAKFAERPGARAVAMLQ